MRYIKYEELPFLQFDDEQVDSPAIDSFLGAKTIKDHHEMLILGHISYRIHSTLSRILFLPLCPDLNNGR